MTLKSSLVHTLVLTGLILAGLVDLVPGQNLNRRQRGGDQIPPQEMPPADVSGTIVGLDNGLIQFVDENNDGYVVSIHPEKTSVIVQGTANIKFLQPGLFVRFQAELDNSGAVEEPLKVLTMFTPRQENSVGIFQDDPESKDMYTVAGRIRNVKKDKYTLVAPLDGEDVPITFTVDEEAEFKVEVSDYSLAMEGDSIKVRGRYYRPGQIVADLVDIKLAKPLGEEETKKRPGRDKKRRTESPN